jgi:hypothetical protein
VQAGAITVCAVVPDEPLKFASPLYTAVRVLLPFVEEVRLQEAVVVAPVPERVHGELVSVPSETVTVPLGVLVPVILPTLMLIA